MGQERVVTPEELTVEAFAPYGQAVLVPRTPAPKTGEDWDCWFGLGSFGECNPVVGIVITRPMDGVVTAMERETKVEFLLPITGPVVQAVALPGDLSDHTQQPDAATVRAFILRPGQAILMAPGTWHWAALPLRTETLYYFVGEPHPPEPGRELSPWVPFYGGDSVRVPLRG
jgi:ureidoglycolate lyase